MRNNVVVTMEQDNRERLVRSLVALSLVVATFQPIRALANGPGTCACAPIGKDPGVIRFIPNGKPDYLKVHGTITPPKDDPNFDPTAETTFVLSNADGVIIDGAVPPLTEAPDRDMRLVYVDRDAKNTGGVASFSLQYRVNEDHYEFDVVAYGDLSAATVAEMAFKLQIGDYCFIHADSWERTSKGWSVDMPDEE